MTTTSKAPTRKHTRASEAKRNDELNAGIRIKVDGRVYEVTAGDLTALDSRALRQQVGVTFLQLLQQAEDSFDIDTLATLMWLARRVEGERNLDFETVAAEVGYDSLESLDFGTDEEPVTDDAPGE